MTLKACDHCISKILPWVKKAETIQVHFTLEGEGPKGSKKLSWMESLYGYLHGGLWIVFHSVWRFVSCLMQIPTDLVN
jgi:hypothetical protein